MNTRAEFGQFLSDYGYKRVAEIGVQRGEFSAQILSQWSGELHLVDAWQNIAGYRDIANVSDEQHAKNLEATVAAVGDRAKIVRGFSVDVAKQYRDAYFDCIYLDANHAYEAVMADLEAWDKKSKFVVAGHDYLDGELYEGSFGVIKAVKEFYGRDPDIVTKEKWPTWIMFK